MALTPQLTATAATATQTSSQINRVAGSTSAIVTIDVTAGTTLSLLLRLQFLASDLVYRQLTVDPAVALTGIATTHYLFTEDTATDVGSGITEVFYTPLPEVGRVQVVHGNANAATYTVTVDFQ